MDYGALITLTDDGFQIPATSLTPIGVYNDTKCWGAFYQNTDMPDFDEAKQHLLLSPIPFGSWACAIRIIARVKDNTGMLHKLLSTLMDDKLCLNIIAIAQTIGGYNHAMVTIVSEAIDLRKEADYIRKEVKDAEKNEAILGFAVKVAHRIVEIDEAISRKEDDFIYTKGKDKLNSESAKSQIKQYCMDPETMDKKVSITNAIDTCLQMTVWNVNWVSSTAYCFFYHPTQPLRFLYDAKRALLRYSDNDAIENRIARTLELPTPLLFLGSFDPLNKYVRLLCVQREMRERRLLKVRYTYECMDKRKDADIAKTGSRGLLCDISDNLSVIKGATAINMRHVSSYTKRLSKTIERGEVELIGTIEAQDKSYSGCLLKDIEQAARECKLRNDAKSPLDVRVSYHTPYKIFLSCREELKQDRNFASLCKRAESMYGVTFLLSTRYADGVTPDVLRKIDDADAMIAIFSITASEHSEYIDSKQPTKYLPNLYWLLFEYGIAKGKGIPLFQFRDTSVVLKEHWKDWISIDKDVYTSHKRISHVEFEDAFGKALSYIEDRLGIEELWHA